jgi:hypothetical protein
MALGRTCLRPGIANAAGDVRCLRLEAVGAVRMLTRPTGRAIIQYGDPVPISGAGASGSSSGVERLLAKEEVTGSNPASRSFFFRWCGGVQPGLPPRVTQARPACAIGVADGTPADAKQDAVPYGRLAFVRLRPPASGTGVSPVGDDGAVGLGVHDRDGRGTAGCLGTAIWGRGTAECRSRWRRRTSRAVRRCLV